MKTLDLRAVGLFFFSSRRRHTRLTCDWSSDVCSSDLGLNGRFHLGRADMVRSGQDLLFVTMGSIAAEAVAAAERLASERIEASVLVVSKIGRASCRERV